MSLSGPPDRAIFLIWTAKFEDLSNPSQPELGHIFWQGVPPPTYGIRRLSFLATFAYAPPRGGCGVVELALHLLLPL